MFVNLLIAIFIEHSWSGHRIIKKKEMKNKKDIKWCSLINQRKNAVNEVGLQSGHSLWKLDQSVYVSNAVRMLFNSNRKID